MTLNDVARRLGMILSPAQEIYRQQRRTGVAREAARLNAYFGAAGLAAVQANAVYLFIQKHAIWTIPEEAFHDLGR